MTDDVPLFNIFGPPSVPDQAAGRRAIIEALAKDEALEMLEPQETALLVEGVLNARASAARAYSSAEVAKVVLWAQLTRLAAFQLQLLHRGLVRIDWHDADIYWYAPAQLPEGVDLAWAAPLLAEQDPDVRVTLASFHASRWLSGVPATHDEEARLAAWARTTRASSMLLETFLQAPGAAIDCDPRGRVIIIAPESAR